MVGPHDEEPCDYEPDDEGDDDLEWVEGRTLHVIPVPVGMTPGEAWAEIDTMGRLVEYAKADVRFAHCTWAVVWGT